MNDGEKILLGEYLVSMSVITIDALRKGAAPMPSSFIGATVVFAMLGVVPFFGAKPARFAAAFGALVVLGMLLAPAVVKGKPATRGAGIADAIAHVGETA